MQRTIIPFLIISLIGFFGCNQKKSSTDIINDIDFVTIPAGQFTMGADLHPKYIAAGQNEAWRSIFIQDEFPVRDITISRDISISKFEITNAQYEAFDPEHSRWRGNFMDLSTKDDEAVVYVSWEDAVAFTTWLSENDTHYSYRLPTEAEWEYVARAGTRTPYMDGISGDVYALNPMQPEQMIAYNYQWPYPFTFSNGCRSWVSWKPENCTGVEDVYPSKFDIKDADLTVGQNRPNGFGVHDMMGNVEEWVMDWYDVYKPAETIDPAGPIKGDFKVIRGGSHNNHIQHMRSANRMASAKDDKHYLLGFRIVRIAKDSPVPTPSLLRDNKPWATEVNPARFQWAAPTEEPFFSIHSLYELVSQAENGSHYGSDQQMRQFGFDSEKQKPLSLGPLYTHNHSPTITWCENGDLLVSWFSGESEIGPELTLLASRGKRNEDGSLSWTEPAEFLKAADRNMHGSNLLNNSLRLSNGTDSTFTIHQMASIGVAGRWDKLGLGYRKSTDNGANWSPVKMVLEVDHALNDGASMQGNMFQTTNNELVFVTDDDGDGIFNTGSLIVSDDAGETWERRGHSSNTPDQKRIAGLHAAVIEILDRDGDGKSDLLAIARDNGQYFDGKAPQSISFDDGHTWERSPTVFPSISSGQRFSLLRLRFATHTPEFSKGSPILFSGFAQGDFKARNGEGEIESISGLFVAISFDDGVSWDVMHRRVLSNLTGDSTSMLTIAPWQADNLLSRKDGQEGGYITSTQTPDGMIHVTDGKLIYSFNLAWVIQ